MGWRGFFLPAGVPADIAQTTAKEVEKVLQLPDIAAKLKAIGVKPGGGTSEEFAQQIKADAPVWAAIAKANNIRVIN